MTSVLQYSHGEREGVLEQAVAMLDNGRAIIFPSDTVYALLAGAGSADAYREIYSVKHRNPEQPLALLAAPSHQVVGEVMKLLEDLEDEQDAFLSGELTAVFPRGRLKKVPQATLALQQGSVGIRIPAWEPLCELIERCGGLLWGTSANISGSDPQTTAGEMQAALDTMDPQPMLCVLIAEELPGNVSDVVRFGPDGPEVIR
ncbi:Sua5/YciO/YrdC/YwlC family protein [bacterium]|nr:Sua5/YciO/YrdC/YwlC family protein [bacterium]